MYKNRMLNKDKPMCNDRLFHGYDSECEEESLYKKDSPHEECAVFGVSVKSNEAVGITYNGLLALQHRGQEGAGIAAIPAQGHGILIHKNTGLVSEVFTQEVMKTFPDSHIAVGHTRYSTTGSNTAANVQPFITEFLTGRIATVHNGNVINAGEIRERLEQCGLDFIASSDSEVVSSLIAYQTVRNQSVLEGTIAAAREIKGAFSLIVLCGERKLIALRDPNGFRPLCLGKNENGMALASESCALESCGFDFVRDILPGELLVIEEGEITYQMIYAKAEKQGLCIFEYVYFSRSDSVLDGQSVYEARVNMGRMLARESPIQADIVCGVPDSGLEAAAGYAAESGLPLVPGFSKNRYIGRSFIFPTQAQRENAVKLKLNPLRVNVAGKRVILIDDSIVRGTTSAQIIRSLKTAGAKEVHLRISSPPFRHSCHFGTDIDNEDKLIANQLSIDELCRKIGADSLRFIRVESLQKACGNCRLPFCTGCFTGNYGMDAPEINKNSLETR